MLSQDFPKANLEIPKLWNKLVTTWKMSLLEHIGKVLGEECDSKQHRISK